jgi:hypothetical protein
MLTVRQIGGVLGRFGVKPREIRSGESTAQGHICDDFNADAGEPEPFFRGRWRGLAGRHWVTITSTRKGAGPT